METWHWLIGQLPFEWAHFAFMHNALLAILIISPLFSLLGCLVINNQMAFFSDAVGHATLTGIAIGVIAGLSDPTWSMLLFAVALALLVSVLKRYSAISTDTLIGLVMAFAVALGVVLLSRGGGFVKYSRYLIGDLLYITNAEILRMLIILALVVILWIVCFNRFLLTFVHRPLALSRGVRIWRWEAIFSCAVAVVVASSISCVGMLVVNSLLIIPAAAARNISRNARQYVGLAMLFSLAAGILGLLLSYSWGTAGGATIVLVAMASYIGTLAIRR